MDPSAIATAVVVFVLISAGYLGTLLYCAIDHFILRPQDQDIQERARAIERMHRMR